MKLTILIQIPRAAVYSDSNTTSLLYSYVSHERLFDIFLLIHIKSGVLLYMCFLVRV